MENGSFQSLNLTDLDFVEPHSSEIKERREQHHSLKSETVETLLSQNEDLMARLKITIRRMTAVEDQLKTTSEELKNLKVTHSATHDQLLIWREKERIWKHKNQELTEQIQETKEKYPDLAKMSYQIERYKRYQEKVKTTIKPYLQQLKDYAHSLHLEIQNLNRELHEKEALLRTQERQIASLREEKEQLQLFAQAHQYQLQEAHENSAQTMRQEIQNLREANTLLESKTEQLNHSLERQDELENLVVALRRSSEDQSRQMSEEKTKAEEELMSLRKSNIELKLFNESFKNELEDLRDKLHKEKSQNFQMDEQLSSLRFMWNKKCEEFDRTLLANKSLEELNKELSQLLNKLREKN